MRRWLVAFVFPLLLLAGCQGPAPVRKAPPSPLIATRSRPQPRYTPPLAPLPPPPEERFVPPPPPPPPAPGVALNPRELTPPGGVQGARWQAIVVHHSSSPRDTPQGMHQYHLKEKRWAGGLGYHFVIGNGVGYPDGKVFVGPRWKRQASGAHCKSDAGRYSGVWRERNFFNTHAVGICLIGNFEQSSPTPKQLATLEALIAWLCDSTRAAPERVYGHGGVTHKTICPGKLLSAKLPSVVRQAAVYAGSVR